MKGNFQVRFLEGGGLATARLYSEGWYIRQTAKVFKVILAAQGRS